MEQGDADAQHPLRRRPDRERLRPGPSDLRPLGRHRAGSPPADGPNSAGPDSGQTVAVDSGTTGPWTGETDIRPTEMYLLGLKAIASGSPGDLLYRGTDKALAALERVRDALALRIKAERIKAERIKPERIKAERIKAERIKAELEAAAFEAAAFEDQPVSAAGPQTLACQAIINSAALLAHNA